MSKWTVPASRRSATDPQHTVKWGRISAQASDSAYDKGTDPHVMGIKRSLNRAAPRGLLRGFANEEQPPALPSSSKNR